MRKVYFQTRSKEYFLIFKMVFEFFLYATLHLLYATLKEASLSMIHFNMKEGNERIIFMDLWIFKEYRHPPINIWCTVVETIVATPWNRVLSHCCQIKLSRHSRLPSLFRVFICTRGIVVTVKIKSLVVSPEILFPTCTCILTAVCFVQHPLEVPSIFSHWCSECIPNKSEFE